MPEKNKIQVIVKEVGKEDSCFEDDFILLAISHRDETRKDSITVVKILRLTTIEGMYFLAKSMWNTFKSLLEK